MKCKANKKDNAVGLHYCGLEAGHAGQHVCNFPLCRVRWGRKNTTKKARAK